MQGFDEYMNLVLEEAEEVSGAPGVQGRGPEGACWLLPPPLSAAATPHLRLPRGPHPPCPPAPSAPCAVKRKTRKALGRVLLKGDTITLMQAAK